MSVITLHFSEMALRMDAAALLGTSESGSGVFQRCGCET